MDTLRPVREVTAEEENFRVVNAHPVDSPMFKTIKRDPVMPEPVGTYVVMCFRIDGYDQDCDGSLMARLTQVDMEGRTTGWSVDSIGLYPDTDLVVEHPAKLWGA
jgi:hypothetical protein